MRWDCCIHSPFEVTLKFQPHVLDEMIAGWKRDLKKYKGIRKSFLKELETLTYIFRWYENNYDEANLVFPFKDRHFERIQIKKSVKGSRKFMTTEEAELFLSHLKSKDIRFDVLALTQMKQMMRISEVCGMKWSKLDLKNKTYTLSEHVVWPRIGGATAYLETGTKSIHEGHSPELNLFTEVCEALSEMKKYPGSDLIFHDQGQLLTYRQVQHSYNAAFKLAKLPFRSTHVLRHSGATEFYNLTGDLLALQQMGTWSNSRMPEHYAKVMSVRAKQAIQKVEGQRTKNHLKVVG